ncbi:hypothetical protein CPB83DRAFT_864082 [Crepidotus variabilis]|uniref:Uncharacterized protein n=1 Tax=Crepidotus variabilis TaxID=179855 RepID=A0A9P6JIV7_9AGAR|nr:hypothetical protein CPB83DRAFT_864082 [Crepidotus variabilis]
MLTSVDRRRNDTIKAFQGAAMIGLKKFCVEVNEKIWPSRRMAHPLSIGDGHELELKRQELLETFGLD